MCAVCPADASDLDEFDNLRHLETIDNIQRIVYGDANGRVHVLEGDGTRFAEVWVSEYLEGAVAGVFVTDVNDDEFKKSSSLPTGDAFTISIRAIIAPYGVTPRRI